MCMLVQGLASVAHAGDQKRVLATERKLDESPPKNDRDTDLANKTAQLERDARDMLQQFQEFEREKEDEVREFHAEIAQLNAKLTEKDPRWGDQGR
eukprot:g24680.t1